MYIYIYIHTHISPILKLPALAQRRPNPIHRFPSDAYIYIYIYTLYIYIYTNICFVYLCIQRVCPAFDSSLSWLLASATSCLQLKCRPWLMTVLDEHKPVSERRVRQCGILRRPHYKPHLSPAPARASFVAGSGCDHCLRGTKARSGRERGFGRAPRVEAPSCRIAVILFVFGSEESCLVRMECPAWCSGGRGP